MKKLLIIPFDVLICNEDTIQNPDTLINICYAHFLNINLRIKDFDGNEIGNLEFKDTAVKSLFWDSTSIKKKVIANYVSFRGSDNLNSSFFIEKNKNGNFLLIISFGEINRMIYKVVLDEIWEFEDGEILGELKIC